MTFDFFKLVYKRLDSHRFSFFFFSLSSFSSFCLKTMTLSSIAGLVALNGCAFIEPTRELAPGMGIVGLSENSPNGAQEKKYGTYIQWDDNYAVAAAHTGPQRNTVYRSKTLDIQFLKLNDTNPAQRPRWTYAKFGETLHMRGYAQTNFYQIRDIQGVAVNYPIVYQQSKAYQLIDAPVIHGMSGGPVVNAQGEVVGMIIGNTTVAIPTLNKEARIHSVYLPYAEIKKEFDKFMSEAPNAQGTPDNHKNNASDALLAPQSLPNTHYESATPKTTLGTPQKNNKLKRKQ